MADISMSPGDELDLDAIDYQLRLHVGTAPAIKTSVRMLVHSPNMMPNTDSLMGSTPEPAECIKIGLLQKMNTEFVWSEREVYLTRSTLWCAS